MRNFEEKNAVITGGTSGMGFATAALLLREGCNVMITGKSADGIEKALAQLSSTGKGNCNATACDISVVAEIETLAETVKRTLTTVNMS